MPQFTRKLVDERARGVGEDFAGKPMARRRGSVPMLVMGMGMGGCFCPGPADAETKPKGSFSNSQSENLGDLLVSWSVGFGRVPTLLRCYVATHARCMLGASLAC